jgi:hypothetical protein
LDRADQTPIEPASEQPVNPPKPVVRPPIDASAPEPATPKLDLPAKPTKSTTRVPIAKIDTTAATATSQSPESPTQAAPNGQHESSAKKREAAAKATSAEAPPTPPAPVIAAPQEAAPEPAQPKSFLSAIFGGGSGQQEPAAAPVATSVAPPKPMKTATAEATPASDGGGGYAVQLAAPGSEAEAQSVSNRLRTKYANELDGLEPSIHKAVIKDKTVYRVRVGSGMTKAAAVSLCEKVRAAGGACFLARE